MLPLQRWWYKKYVWQPSGWSREVPFVDYYNIDLSNPLADHPLTKGLVGCWIALPQLAKGSIWYDLSGYNNHGTLTNMDPSTDWVYDGDRMVLDFDGSYDRVQLSSLDFYAPSSTEALSAVVWWKSGSSLINQDLFGRASASWSVKNWTWNIYTYSSGELSAGIGDGSSFQYNANGSPDAVVITPNTWYFVVFVIGKTGEPMLLYVNGVDQNITWNDNSQNRTLNQLRQSADSFYIGGDYASTNGQIAMAAVYNRALSSDEVADLYDESRRGYPNMLRRLQPNKIVHDQISRKQLEYLGVRREF